ncbi:MAG: cell division protein ZapA [Marinicaulis sp.]|nr:cell division protein ZapA [Marinicaulis sp.]NNE39591.1 cell division protein ZapA [Marinicaulis sp.]NNL88469.1 cell division protein ZapA [Marinicaulis sp.]
MAHVVIQVNGRDYKITCEDGQEDRLLNLAAYFDRHVTDLTHDLGQIGDARLMLLAALTVCDELFEAKARAKDYENAADKLDDDTVGAAGRAIEAAVARVEEISSRFETN